MPGQARTRGVAANQFAGHHGMEVVHGFGLHANATTATSTVAAPPRVKPNLRSV
jgi:hypothetical protein